MYRNKTISVYFLINVTCHILVINFTQNQVKSFCFCKLLVSSMSEKKYF